MKIVKRDGRTVDYNPDKIRIAIGKANNEVSEKDKIDEKDIEEIIKYIESLDKKRMLVEDIQDIIEEKIMEKGKFNLGKKYIIYRYVRSIVRKSNNTDVSLLALLRNSNEVSDNYLAANKQREVMIQEASRDLAFRLLLPENVVNSIKNNSVLFAKVEHFTEPVIESAKINLSDMLESGTVINGIKIESPKSFQSACNILVEIIGEVACCQTDTIYIDLKDLYKYYVYSYEKRYALYKSLMKNELSNDQVRALSETQSFLEVKSGIQTIFYELNTILSNANVPKVFFLLNINEIETPYEEKIAFEFIKQKEKGFENENGKQVRSTYPGIVYCYDEESENGKKYDYITHELISAQVDCVLMKSKRYEKFVTDLKRFNQGSMILNLGRIALGSNDFDEFMVNLEENLGFCYEGMRCRNHNLQGVYSDKSPVHWKNGAIARLKESEKIDDYLKKDYSFMQLVLIGFESAFKLKDFSLEQKRKISKFIETVVQKWNNENNFEIVLSNYFDEHFVYEIMRNDEENFKVNKMVNYFDSLEFMKKDYFSNCIKYVQANNSVDALLNMCDDEIVVISYSSDCV